jgi:mono/diheme cytochrome c family protein
MMRSARPSCVTAPFVLVLSAILVPAVNAQSPGFFSAPQTERGAVIYAAQCEGCHGSNLRGGNRTPALTGDGFWGKWDSQIARKLYSIIITTMPANDPGNLSEPEATDVLAFILRGNGVPVGDKDIAQAKELNDIILHRP